MIPKTRFFVGLDLGQAADPTALAIVERVRPGTFADTLRDHQAGKTLRPIYRVGWLKRAEIGTPYPKIVEWVAALMADKRLAPEPHLYVDATGVGRPVVDLLMEHEIAITPVSIHGGRAETQSGGWLNLPKRELITRTNVLLGQRRLKITNKIAESEVLRREFENYRVKIDQETAHDSYNAREGAHDDIVLAVSLGVYGASSWNADEWDLDDGRDPGNPNQIAQVALALKQEQLATRAAEQRRQEEESDFFPPSFDGEADYWA